MATRHSIEINFRTAIAQADKLDRLADKLYGVSDNRFNGALQNLTNVWKGENASNYMNKGIRLQSKMRSSVNDLHNVASSIRSIATRIRNAELRALEVAESRKY